MEQNPKRAGGFVATVKQNQKRTQLWQNNEAIEQGTRGWLFATMIKIRCAWSFGTTLRWWKRARARGFLQQWNKMKSASSFDITLEQENGTRGRLSASMKQEIKNVQNYGATIKLNPKCARSMSASIKQNKVRHFIIKEQIAKHVRLCCNRETTCKLCAFWCNNETK